MGGKSAPKVDVPSLDEIIRMEKELNRVDSVTPFGQSIWNGNRQETSFSPQMQAASDRMFETLGQGQQRFEPPAFMNDIFGAVANRVGERYGLSGMDTSKPPPSQQMPQMPAPPGGIDAPAPMPSQPSPLPTVPNPGQPQPPGFGGVNPDEHNEQIRNLLQQMPFIRR